MSTQIVQQFQGELRVSSDAIAEHTENQHKNVLELIDTYGHELEVFGQVAFETRAGYNNAQVRIAQLTEQQATLLITYMRNSGPVRDFKLRLVREFYEMRQALTAPVVPQSLPDALRAYALEVEQRQALEAQVAVDAPKVDYVDTFVADSDLRLLRNVAKSIGMGEQELRSDLVARKWIYHERSTRWSDREQRKVPHDRYSPYAHKAQYFEPVPNHQAPRFKGEVMHTLKVTPQGAVAIARLYGKHLVAVEAVS